MELIRINSLDGKLGEYAKSLLTGSFPEAEYRDMDEWKRITEEKRNFYNNIIIDKEKTVGILTYWHFELFVYIEHFAVDPLFRGGGYGTDILSHFVNMVQCPVVLEVERPMDEQSKRRISFYQRNGFRLWTADYWQPAYRKGGAGLPLYLMVYGNLDENEYFNFIRNCLYVTVYGVEEYAK